MALITGTNHPCWWPLIFALLLLVVASSGVGGSSDAELLLKFKESLSNNKFYGEIPAQTFQGMQWLKKIHLSNNQFTGAIPTSLASLPRLMELRLEGNKFSGHIPRFHKCDKIKVTGIPMPPDLYC